MTNSDTKISNIVVRFQTISISSNSVCFLIKYNLLSVNMSTSKNDLWTGVQKYRWMTNIHTHEQNQIKQNHNKNTHKQTVTIEKAKKRSTEAGVLSGRFSFFCCSKPLSTVNDSDYHAPKPFTNLRFPPSQTLYPLGKVEFPLLHKSVFSLSRNMPHA